MKNLQTLCLSLALLFAITIGLNAQAAPETTAPKKLVVGLIVPLTGPLAFFGKDYVRAYELAVAARPELKELLDIRWEDSAYDSKQATTAFNKLVLTDKAQVIMSFGGPMLSALAPLAQAKQIPFFATESAKADCQDRSYCSLFRNEENEWGQATWKLLRKQKQKKIGIIKNQNQFMNTFVNALDNTKSSEESVEILLDLPPDTSDLRTQILSLRNKQYDALGIYLLPGSHHGFLSASRSLKVKFPLFGVEEFLVKENNHGYEDIVNGTHVIAPAASNEYRERFEKQFGYSAGFFYTPAFYDFANLLADVIKTAPAARGTELVKAMRFTGSREGVSGKYSVKVSEQGVHSYSFPIAIYRVDAGQTVVEEIIEF